MGFKRPDGQVGIRNYLEIVFTVECAREVAFRIASGIEEAQLIGFSGCLFNQKAFDQMVGLGKHPNVGAVLIVSLGCEGTDGRELKRRITESGRPVELLSIQESGGTVKAVETGRKVAEQLVKSLSGVEEMELAPQDLVVGVECGASDATSGIAANPAAGAACDRLIDSGATILIEEITELLGCQEALAQRARDANVAGDVTQLIEKARKHSIETGSFTISPGNNSGGLTTIEEKSLGALAKAGTRPVEGVLELGQFPTGRGLFLIDTVGNVDAGPKCLCRGGDVAGNVSLLSSGAHMVIFTTGKGNVVGVPLAPVIKVCGNPTVFAKMADNMDINAGGIIHDEVTIEDVGKEIYVEVVQEAGGKRTRTEILGHEEFIIPYRH